MKVCCLFNIAPLYRTAIYTLMDNDPDIEFDFWVGETAFGGIATMDARSLKGFRGYLRNCYGRGDKLLWQRRAVRAAFSKKYDAYLLTGNLGIRSNWIIALTARLLGRKVYLWSHGLHGGESAAQRRKALTYFRLAGRLLLYGERAKTLLTGEGFPPGRMSVIYNSLDYDLQLRIRERIGDRAFLRNYFGNDDPVLSFVGRLTAGKRIDLLLRAVAQLPGCNVVLVGDGAARSELQRQVEALGLADRVWFYGESHDQLFTATLLYHSAACVSPGNVGLTALHALTFGTPVVTHNDPARQMPEYEAITDGVTGSLFTPDDPDDLARKIAPWLSKTPAEREATRLLCHRVIETTYNPHHQWEILRGTLFEDRGHTHA